MGLNPDSDWTLWAYECSFDATSSRDPARLLSMEYTNWRERQQAANLGRLLESAPGDLGGTAGILRAQAPPPLDQRAGVEPPETLLTEDGA